MKNFFKYLILFIFPLNLYSESITNYKEYIERVVLPDYWHLIREKEADKRFDINIISRFNMVYHSIDKNPPDIKNYDFIYLHLPSYEPNIKITFWANPEENVAWGFSFGLNIDFADVTNKLFQLANNYILFCELKTLLGEYYIKLGGPEWRLLTPFSFSTPGWHWAYNPFERNSWDSIWLSYWKYKSLSEISKYQLEARSEGAPGAKGFYVDGWKLPFDLHTTLFWGKMDNYSLFFQKTSYLFYSLVERYFTTFKTGAVFKSLIINTSNLLNEEGFNENRALFFEYYGIKDNKFYFEYGNSVTKYNHSSTIKGNGFLFEWKRNWQSFLVFNSLFSAISLFYIEPDFLGEYTGVYIIKKSIEDFPLTYYGDNYMGMFRLYNNAYGFNFNSDFLTKFFKFMFKFSFYQTLTPTSNKINYPHSLNHSIWYVLYSNIEPWCKSYSYFQNNYHFLTTYWEGASENVYLKNSEFHNRTFNFFSSGLVIILNNIFPQLKESYLYFNYLQKIMNNKFKFNLTFLNKKEFLFSGNLFYIFFAQRIVKGLYFLSFYGNENWYSEKTTAKISQNDEAYGLGIDYIFNSHSALFVKIRRYEFNDDTFYENNMKGFNVSVEFKFEY